MGARGFLESVPVYVRRVLLVGTRMELLAPALHARGITTSGEGAFDAALVDALALEEGLGRVLPLLAPHGLLCCVLPDDDSAARAVESLRGVGFEAALPVACTLEGVTVRVVQARRADYDLHEHARLLRAEGRPDLAFCVLRDVSIQGLASDDEAVAVAADLQVSLLVLDHKTGGAGRVSHFHIAQMAFYQAVARAPRNAVVYQCQAEFWRRLGSPSMARRLLRSVQRVAPSAVLEKQIASYEGRAEATVAPIPEPPEWEGGWTPRVLFITHPRIDYGLDTLCDGLRGVLGAERVVEYPWKPSLHGDVPARLANYPCCFNHPGSALSLEAILAQLRGGEFDLLLFGDTELNIDRDEARRIAEAAGDLPWAIVDQGDDPIDRRPEIAAYLGRRDLPPYFKREMLCCHDYGEGVFPLPFAYPDGRIPAESTEARSEDLFWAGHREFGLRRLYLERLEGVLGRSLGRVYTQEEYAGVLRASRVGLSLFGGGFDTVRYWELPAHGCVLLAERPPIRIPWDFEDGVSAIFFGDLPELEERLEACLARPEDVCRIAAAGRERLRRYHTGSARASQLIARLGAMGVR